jgi:predicted branched-subunit amino acid permease
MTTATFTEAVLRTERGAELRRAARAGATAMLPLLAGVAPFALVIGTSAAASDAPWAGLASAPLVYAGASQLAAIRLLDDGAGVLLVVATALLLNARLVLVSTALSSRLRGAPASWRRAASALAVEQSYAVTLTERADALDPEARSAYFFGGAALLWSGWVAVTVVGFALGGGLPDWLGLDVVGPLALVTIVVPAVRTRPALAAALTGGAIAFLARGLPSGTGILAGALAGALAGGFVERRSS